MNYKNILTALSDIETKTPSYDIANIIADQSGAKITLLHSYEQLSNTGLSYTLPSFVDIEQQEISKAHCLLEKLKNKSPNVCCSLHIEKGKKKCCILKQARKIHADLIVLEKDKTRASKKLTEYLLSKAPCDILAINSELH